MENHNYFSIGSSDQTPQNYLLIVSPQLLTDAVDTHRFQDSYRDGYSTEGYTITYRNGSVNRTTLTKHADGIVVQEMIFNDTITKRQKIKRWTQHPSGRKQFEESIKDISTPAFERARMASIQSSNAVVCQDQHARTPPDTNIPALWAQYQQVDPLVLAGVMSDSDRFEEISDSEESGESEQQNENTTRHGNGNWNGHVDEDLQHRKRKRDDADADADDGDEDEMPPTKRLICNWER